MTRQNTVIKNKKSRSITYFAMRHYVSIFLVMFVVIFLVDTYQNHSSMNSVFYFPNEPPWLPDSIKAIPITGQHFFGDFQLPWVMAKGNPFSQENPFNNILPLGYLPYILLSGIELKIAFMFYSLITIVIYVFSIKVFSKIESFSVFELVPIMLFNISIFWCLDRGAAVLMVTSLFFLSVQVLYRKSKNHLFNHFTYFLIAFCLSAKIYLLAAIFLLVVGQIIKLRPLVFIITYFALGNIFFSYLYTGPVAAAKQILFSLLHATGDGLTNVASIWCVNFASDFVKVAAHLNLDTHSTKIDVALLSVLSLVLSVLIILKYKNTGITIMMSLSMIEFVATVSYRYTTIWALYGFILVTKSQYFQKIREGNSYTYRSLLVSLLLALFPLPLALCWTIPASWLFTNLLLLFENTVASASRKTRQSVG